MIQRKENALSYGLVPDIAGLAKTVTEPIELARFEIVGDFGGTFFAEQLIKDIFGGTLAVDPFDDLLRVGSDLVLGRVIVHPRLPVTGQIHLFEVIAG